MVERGHSPYRGPALDARNLHPQVTKGRFLEPTGRTITRDGGCPAELYRRGTVEPLHPPLLRGER